jgi:hypothetical protein
LQAVGARLPDLPLGYPAPHGLGVAWTCVEDQPPEPPGFYRVAPLLGQDGEVAQGEVAVDSLVDAAELVGALERQDPSPAGFGFGGLTGFTVKNGFAEMQLGVVGVDPQALGARVQGRRNVSDHLVAAGDQGEELAHDRIGGGRSGKAALEVAQGGWPVLPLDGD